MTARVDDYDMDSCPVAMHYEAGARRGGPAGMPWPIRRKVLHSTTVIKPKGVRDVDELYVHA